MKKLIEQLFSFLLAQKIKFFNWKPITKSFGKYMNLEELTRIRKELEENIDSQRISFKNEKFEKEPDPKKIVNTYNKLWEYQRDLTKVKVLLNRKNDEKGISSIIYDKSFTAETITSLFRFKINKGRKKEHANLLSKLSELGLNIRKTEDYLKNLQEKYKEKLTELNQKTYCFIKLQTI